MSRRRRESQDFSSSIQSFLLEESKKSELSTSASSNQTYFTSKSTNYNPSSPNSELPPMDFTADDNTDFLFSANSKFSSDQSSKESFRTAFSKIKLENSRRSSTMSLDSLEESNPQDTSFKDHVKRTIRRMSQHYQRKPLDFTKKLISILEESCRNSYGEEPRSSEVSLDQLTNEFIMLCKFIEDESMPDLAPSIIDTTLSPKKGKSPGRQNDISLFRSLFTKSNIKTVLSPKSFSNNSTPTKANNETYDFEQLEKFCHDLCKNEDGTPRTPKKSTIRLNTTATSIYTICEQQMALLEEGSLVEENLSQENLDKSIDELNLDKSVVEKKSEKSIDDIFFTPRQSFEVFDEDLKKEIFKKKQRCLDFAKEMKEIENCKKYEEEDNEEEGFQSFVNTLNKCMEYKDWLTTKTEESRRNSILKAQAEVKKSTLKIPARPISLQKSASKIPGLSKPKAAVKPMVAPPRSAKKEEPIRNACRNTGTIPKVDLKKRLFVTSSPNLASQRSPLSWRTSELTQMRTPNKKLVDNKSPLSKSHDYISKYKPEKRETSKVNQPVTEKKEPKHIVNLSKAIDDAGGRKLEREVKAKSPKEVLENRSPATKNLTPVKSLTLVKNLTPVKHLTPLWQPMRKGNKSPGGSFFVTPGHPEESGKKKFVKKGPFFSDEDALKGKKETLSSEKLTPTSLNKLKYSNVKSPLSRYINYKDTNLLQKVQATTNDMLLTPEKGNSTDTLKIPLSPKLQVIGTENRDPSLPRVYYKSADQVQVTKNTQKKFSLRGILEPINNKVVIKHKGRLRTEDEEISVIEERLAF